MQIKRGYILAVCGVCLHAVSDAVVKFFVEHYEVSVVVLIQVVVRFLLLSFYVIAAGINPYKTRHPYANAARALLAAICTQLFAYAYKYAPMTSVVTIAYAASIIVIPLSYWILKERITIRNVSAIIIGFIGLLFAFRPQIELRIGLIFAGLIAFIGAVNRILVKKLSFSDNEVTLLFYHHTVLVLFLLPNISYCNIDLSHLLMIVFSGFISILAQLLIIRAYKFASCTNLASASYVILIPTIVIDFCVYNRIPDMYGTVGALLIMLATMIAGKKKIK